jgi:hypothetical protein
LNDVGVVRSGGHLEGGGGCVGREGRSGRVARRW